MPLRTISLRYIPLHHHVNLKIRPTSRVQDHKVGIVSNLEYFAMPKVYITLQTMFRI